MKKFFVVLISFALVAGSAFAEFSVGGQWFGQVPIVQGAGGKTAAAGAAEGVAVDDTIYAGPTGFGATSGGTGVVRGRINITGKNDEGTFGGWLQGRLTEEANLGSIGSVWWQPISQVKLDFGYLEQAPFSRGGAGGFSDYVDIFGVYTYMTHHIFMGWNGTIQGLALNLMPMDGLTIAALVPYSAKKEITDQYSDIDVYAAYTLPDIGIIGLEFAGNNFDNKPAPGKPATAAIAEAPAKADLTTGVVTPAVAAAKAAAATDPTYNNPYVNIGFKLTAVENLGVQVGARIPFANTLAEKTTAQAPIMVLLGATYTAGQLSIAGNVETTFGAKYDVDSGAGNKIDYEGGLGLQVGLEPRYNIGVGTVGAILGFKMTTTDRGGEVDAKNDTVSFGISPYFEKAISGGAIWFGFAFNLTNYTNDETYKDDYGSMTWSIPLGMLLSF